MRQPGIWSSPALSVMVCEGGIRYRELRSSTYVAQCLDEITRQSKNKIVRIPERWEKPPIDSKRNVSAMRTFRAARPVNYRPPARTASHDKLDVLRLPVAPDYGELTPMQIRIAREEGARRWRKSHWRDPSNKRIVSLRLCSSCSRTRSFTGACCGIGFGTA